MHLPPSHHVDVTYDAPVMLTTKSDQAWYARQVSFPNATGTNFASATELAHKGAQSRDHKLLASMCSVLAKPYGLCHK